MAAEKQNKKKQLLFSSFLLFVQMQKLKKQKKKKQISMTQLFRARWSSFFTLRFLMYRYF
jgi:hypothetical protein